MKNYILFAFSALLLACSNGQEANVIVVEKSHKRIYKFDFEMFTNHIYLPSFFNDTISCYLMMDCGANYLYLDSIFAENYFGEKPEFTALLEGIGSEGMKKAKAYAGSKCTICNVESNYKVTMAPNIRRTFGDKIDGIIGGGILFHHIWFFNFKHNEFEISESLPDSIRQNWKRIPLFTDDKKRFYIHARIDLTDSISLDGKFIFDTGFGTTVGILAEYARKYRLDTLHCEKLEAIHHFSGASGKSSRYTIKGKQLQINDFAIEQPTLSVSLDKSGSLAKNINEDVIGYIGANALKLMHHVVIDFPGKAIYYCPKENSTARDLPFYTTGLDYVNNKISDIGYPIKTISADLNDKINPNDFIMKVNGISVFDSTLNMKKIYAESKNITYTLWQNGTITELTLPIIKIE